MQVRFCENKAVSLTWLFMRVKSSKIFMKIILLIFS